MNLDLAEILCAKSLTFDGVSLFNEDLVYHSHSLKHLRSLDESALMLDAQIKTYPTRLLTRALAKFIALEFLHDTCWFSTDFNGDKKKTAIGWDSSSYRYDLKSDSVVAHSEHDDLSDANACALKSKGTNVEGDVAGTVTYIIYIPDIARESSIKSKLEDEKMILKLIHLGTTCGYDFVAADADNKHLYIKYEARYLDAQFMVSDELYHIAPKSLKQKILKQGLVPKSKSAINGKLAKHSDRVYLFNSYNEDLFKQFMMQTGKMSLKYSQMLRLLGQSREYSIFKIDYRKMPSLKLYRDNMFLLDDKSHPTALYTYSNIKPEAIEFVKDIYIE